MEMLDTVSGNAAEIMGSGDIAFPHLGIYLHNVPQGFSVFGFYIAFYGVIIGIGMLLAFALITRQAKKQGMNPEDFFDAGIYAIIFGILGARIYYVIFQWDYYSENLSQIINIRGGGLAIYGGAIAGGLTLFIYCRIKKKDFLAMSDIAFMGMLVGQICGRWGNFMNREVFGTYTDNLLAMRIPIDAVRLRDIDEAIAMHIGNSNFIQVHPTFLYESIYNLILLILILVFQKKKHFNGEVTLWYFGGYGIGRFIIEGIRTDRLLIAHTNIAVSQMLGLCLFVAALVIDIVVNVNMSRRKITEEASK